MSIVNNGELKNSCKEILRPLHILITVSIVKFVLGLELIFASVDCVIPGYGAKFIYTYFSFLAQFIYSVFYCFT